MEIAHNFNQSICNHVSIEAMTTDGKILVYPSGGDIKYGACSADPEPTPAPLPTPSPVQSLTLEVSRLEAFINNGQGVKETFNFKCLVNGVPTRAGPGPKNWNTCNLSHPASN